MATNGTDYKIYVNTAAEGATPVYTLVGEQRDCKSNRATTSIDASHKGTPDQVIMKGGRRSATLSLDALDVPDDEAQAAIEAAYEAGEFVTVVKTKSGVAATKALYHIDSLDENAPDQGVATLSISMTRSGGWLPLEDSGS